MSGCKSCKGSGVLFGKPCFKCKGGERPTPPKKKRRKNPDDASSSSSSSSSSAPPWKTIGGAAATIVGLFVLDAASVAIRGKLTPAFVMPGATMIAAWYVGGGPRIGKKGNTYARGMIYGAMGTILLRHTPVGALVLGGARAAPALQPASPAPAPKGS
jgi:hypothetical protein